MRTIRLLAGTLALVTGAWTAEASAAELKVLSAGAIRGALQELGPAFEAASGHKLQIEYATAGIVEQKVAADDEIDLAVKKGATKPDIGSVEAVKKALLNAKSVAYPDPASGATSGLYLAQTFE